MLWFPGWYVRFHRPCGRAYRSASFFCVLCSRNSAPLHSTLRLVRCLHPLAFGKSPRSVAAHVSSTYRLRRSIDEYPRWRYRMVSGSHRFCAKLRNHRRPTDDVRQIVLQRSKEIEKLQMMKNKASKLICELKQHGQIKKKTRRRMCFIKSWKDRKSCHCLSFTRANLAVHRSLITPSTSWICYTKRMLWRQDLNKRTV